MFSFGVINIDPDDNRVGIDPVVILFTENDHVRVGDRNTYDYIIDQSFENLPSRIPIRFSTVDIVANSDNSADDVDTFMIAYSIMTEILESRNEISDFVGYDTPPVRIDWHVANTGVSFYSPHVDIILLENNVGENLSTQSDTLNHE